MAENTSIESIKAVFEHDDVKKRFDDMLGKKAAGFIISVINEVQNNTLLTKATRDSILFAAATAAMLDLPINPNLGFAYIVPYKDKAQFQMGYKGFIQLAQRTGQFKTIAAAPIYEGQLIGENPLTGFEFDFTKRKSDKVLGYAGYFSLISGFEKVMFMTIEELKKHGKQYSQSYKKGKGLWEDKFDSMAIKTVLKLLLSKFAPLSIEMQTAILTDQAVVNDWNALDLDYADNTPLNPEEVSLEKEEARIKKWIEEAKTMEKLEEVGEYIGDLSEEHILKPLYLAKKKNLNEKE